MPLTSPPALEHIPGVRRRTGKRGVAWFSEFEHYRYALWRPALIDGLIERGEGTIAFCLLNPSTADADQNDPTITRLIGFAKAWKFAGLVIVNAFAWRATDPKAMIAHPNPVGDVNNDVIAAVARQADKFVCGWGNHGGYAGRDEGVLGVLRANSVTPYCFAMTGAGQPQHPLYLPKTAALVAM